MPLALAAAAMLVCFGLGLTLPRPVRRVLSWLAALSYSFYLWHQMLAVFLKYDLHLPAWSGDTPPNQLGDTVWMQQAHALYWTAAIAVTLAAYYGVEKPVSYTHLDVYKRQVYPFRTSVLFTDSLPLAALFFKLLGGILPTRFQYFGWWGLLCYALQGGLAQAVIARIAGDVYKRQLLTVTFASSSVWTAVRQ